LSQVESIPIQAHFNELADNAIGAGAREITFTVVEQAADLAPTSLAICDKGVGIIRRFRSLLKRPCWQADMHVCS
jgi:hypothetical protein